MDVPPPLPSVEPTVSVPPALPEPAPFPGIGFATLLTVVFGGVQMLIGVIITLIAGIIVAITHTPRFNLTAVAAHPGALIVANSLAFAVILGWSAAMNGWQWRKLLPLHLPRLGAWPAVVVTTVGLVLMLSEIDNLVQAVLPMPESFARMMREIIGNQSAPWLSGIVLVLVAPLTEEPMFRGIILRGLLARHRPALAIGVSAALFALVHLNPWQFFPPLILGLVYGWWYARTGSLWPGVLGHALNNFGAFAASYIPFQIPGLSAGPDGAAAGVAHLPWPFLVIGVLLTAAGLWWSHRTMPRGGAVPSSGAA